MPNNMHTRLKRWEHHVLRRNNKEMCAFLWLFKKLKQRILSFFGDKIRLNDENLPAIIQILHHFFLAYITRIIDSHRIKLQMIKVGIVRYINAKRMLYKMLKLFYSIMCC